MGAINWQQHGISGVIACVVAAGAGAATSVVANRPAPPDPATLCARAVNACAHRDPDGERVRRCQARALAEECKGVAIRSAGADGGP